MLIWDQLTKYWRYMTVDLFPLTDAHAFHIDRQLTTRLYEAETAWLQNCTSWLATSPKWQNKPLIYKAILKRVWTYCIKLWETNISNFNLVILQRFLKKLLRSITNASWYVSNVVTLLQRSVNRPSVIEDVNRPNANYRYS